jgi:spore coat protein U-like protein
MQKNKSSRFTSLSLGASLTLGGALFLAGPADAATATDNIAVGATVTANCTIAASPLAFGAYDPVVTNASAPLTGATSVAVTCTNGAPVTVTLGQGLHDATGTAAAPVRRMLSGTTDFLAYNLFTDVGRGTVWGNTLVTGVDSTGSGVSQTVDIFGTVAPGQNVVTGTYADTVVATVTF